MEDLTSPLQDVRGAECAADTTDDALLRQFAGGDAVAARQLTDRLGPRCFSVGADIQGPDPAEMLQALPKDRNLLTIRAKTSYTA